MASRKHLNAVAHDIAHHAVSGLSFLHPHLGQACRRAKTLEVTLELTRGEPLPSDFPTSEPLLNAARSLYKTFCEILAKKGFGLKDVRSAELRFQFGPQREDDYSCSCRSRLVTSDGREYCHTL